MHSKYRLNKYRHCRLKTCRRLAQKCIVAIKADYAFYYIEDVLDSSRFLHYLPSGQYPIYNVPYRQNMTKLIYINCPIILHIYRKILFWHQHFKEFYQFS
jgi:hypothetical protein